MDFVAPRNDRVVTAGSRSRSVRAVPLRFGLDLPQPALDQHRGKVSGAHPVLLPQRAQGVPGLPSEWHEAPEVPGFLSGPRRGPLFASRSFTATTSSKSVRGPARSPFSMRLRRGRAWFRRTL